MSILKQEHITTFRLCKDKCQLRCVKSIKKFDFEVLLYYRVSVIVDFKRFQLVKKTMAMINRFFMGVGINFSVSKSCFSVFA